MGRYAAQLTSSAALAANTGFFWLMGHAGGGAKLRRITGGVVAGATTPTSQQVVIGVNRTTSAGTTPTSIAAHKLDPNSPAAAMTPVSAFATPPTLTATDQFSISFNTQTGFDLPWEQLEEWVISTGTTHGIALINRVNGMPASHSFVVSVEWEE